MEVTTTEARRLRGSTNYHAGVAAEEAVLRHYTGRGLRLRERRWRGASGEIDLILEWRDARIFVEVKKSRSFDCAVESLTHHQITRIVGAAGEYLASPGCGPFARTRFDVAAVNDMGEVRILPGAFGDGW